MDVIKKLGPIELTRAGLSYLRALLKPKGNEEDLESWVSNRFGKRLYQLFFKSYTEKVWGVPVLRAARRVGRPAHQGPVVLLGRQGRLLRQPRQHQVADPRVPLPALRPRPDVGDDGRRDHRRRRRGPHEHRGHAAATPQSGRVVAVHAGGERIECSDVISSLPLRLTVGITEPAASTEVQDAARGLRYRDFLTVALVIDGEDLFPDNWIYIHEPGVRVGRIQNFRSWSPWMVPDPSKASVGLEYFCFQGDDLWDMDDDGLVALATREIEQLGLAQAGKVERGFVTRVPLAYPMYDADYKERVDAIRGWLEGFSNLQQVGRNGLHRYNNSDHSMLTSIRAVENILDGCSHDLWEVNAESVYHEEDVADEHPYRRAPDTKAMREPLARPSADAAPAPAPILTSARAPPPCARPALACCRCPPGRGRRPGLGRRVAGRAARAGGAPVETPRALRGLHPRQAGAPAPLDRGRGRSCPSRPDGTLERFRVHRRSVLAPGCARRFPQIRAYAGRERRRPPGDGAVGHSVRSASTPPCAARGLWYVDPCYRAATARTWRTTADAAPRSRSVARGRPIGSARASAPRCARPGAPSCSATYRLALASDPSYADVVRPTDRRRRGHGRQGDARQPRQPGLQRRARHQHAADRQRPPLNFNTDAEYSARATAPPECDDAGAGAQPGRDRQRSSARPNYDIGHLVLGPDGDGGGHRRRRRRSGARASRAQGCTGARPAGRRRLRDRLRRPRDGAPVRRPAHVQRRRRELLRRQPASRSAAVEPGSAARSIMAYAGICG